MNIKGSPEWVLAPHICRQCFGRLLVRQKSGRTDYIFRCACCGAQATGQDASVMCWCGATLAEGKDMGMRCQHNDSRSSEWLPEIVAKVQEPKL